MSHPALVPHPMTRTATALSPRIWYLVVLAVGFALAAAAVEDRSLVLGLLIAASTLVALSLLIRSLAHRHDRAVASLHEQIGQFVAHDAAPSFTTDADGQIGYQNRAASDRFGVQDGQTLIRALGDLFANPSAILYRLQTRAAATGAAREDVVTRRGHVRLAVHQIGPTGFFWRLDELVDRNAGGRGAEGLSLPMLTASKSGTILFMNEAMRRIVGGRSKTLAAIFPQPFVSGQETEVIGEEGTVRALVADLEGTGGRREIYLMQGTVPAQEGGLDHADFEDLPVALLQLGAAGRVEAANRLARGLVNYPADGEVHLSDLVEGLGRPVADWLADAAAGRALNQPEVLRAILPETDVYLQITLRRTTQRGATELVAVLSDATELKTLEAQFVQSQKMQAIGQLAGGVAHDFNNLLTAISGHCDLLLLRHDEGDPEYADLVQISQNSNRAASLVGQLLAFSRKQTLQPEVVDLRDALADLAHLLNRLVGEKIKLTLAHDPDLRPIRADKRQLEQVIMNLVVNARDAMPQGGPIRIETASVQLAQPLARDRAIVPAGDYVIVRVADSGCGIPADKLTKIFEPFFTTKRVGEGTGLGLSTAYGIVKQTGGFIFVDSEPGEGTTFSLYFPAHEGVATPAPKLPARASAATTQPGEGVILLVEDEAPVRAFASRALRLRGYTVLEAENAEDALRVLEDPALTVDIFVTDVIMPGMDGPTWVRQAMRDRPDVRVVFVSGYAEDSFAETQARIPNSVFLPKPFSLSELTATVQRQAC